MNRLHNLLGSAISRGPRSLRKSIMSCWGSQRRPALQVCSLLGHTWRAYSTAAGIKIRNRNLFCPGHPHQWRLLVPAEHADRPHSQTKVGPICLCSAPTERNGFRSPCPGPARLIASKNLVPLLSSGSSPGAVHSAHWHRSIRPFSGPAGTSFRVETPV